MIRNPSDAPMATVRAVAVKARHSLWLARTLGWAGMLPALRPEKYRHVITDFRRYGLAPATAVAISAVRSPDRTALVDDDGSCTWAELDRRSTALAVELAHILGKKEPTIAVMARNSRPFVEAACRSRSER